MGDSFSKRHGYSGSPPAISVREDAPEGFRQAVIEEAYAAGLSPTPVRDLVCRKLRVRPDPNNWSEWPNVAYEVEGLVHSCEWFRVYDIAEDIHVALGNQRRFGWRPDSAPTYEHALNEAMVDLGIGWRMASGKIVSRGTPEFEQVLQRADGALAAMGRATAAGEIKEALRDLSRRPSPDRTGAIQHGMAALECVARDVCGEPSLTLGKLLGRPDLKQRMGIPAPLDSAIEKAWGFASGFGRHLEEGREPSYREVELVVSVCAALCTYLSTAENRC